MSNKITELVFILDKSGSMAGMESDVVGGFNSLIKEQKTGEGKVLVSTVLFSSYSQVLHDRVSLEKVEEMKVSYYKVGGSTALLDAIGNAVRHIGNIHKYARPEDVPEKTLFVITTDGMENASREFSSEKVKQMIKRQTEKYGWEFLFAAANIDAVETAETIGIRRDRAANYNVERGTSAMFKEMESAIRDVRSCGKVRDNWAYDLEMAQSAAITPKTPQNGNESK